MRVMKNMIRLCGLMVLIFLIVPTKNKNQGNLDVRMCLLPNVGCIVTRPNNATTQ
jgi:hypothetical protein